MFYVQNYCGQRIIPWATLYILSSYSEGLFLIDRGFETNLKVFFGGLVSILILICHGLATKLKETVMHISMRFLYFLIETTVDILNVTSNVR